MSRDQEPDVRPITSIEQLIQFFELGNTELNDRMVGTEHEKFVFRTDRVGSPLMQFKDKGGIEEIFLKLQQTFDWQPIIEDGHLIALTRNNCAISLEPAGQLELSGRPLRTIHETKDELQEHLRELAFLSKDYAAYCAFGLNPFVTGGELPWVPRKRYELMRNYMANQGPLGHWMMQTTCTIQANFDYTSQADAVDMIHTAILVSPIVNAIFANSPIIANRVSDFQSYRAHIWAHTDNDRCGVPDFMYSDDFNFLEYIEWTLDIPLYYISREEGYLVGNGITFRQFLENGWNGHQATIGDYAQHLSTLFPEVRLKQYIEVRCADAGPLENIIALPALWKGILYDSEARAGAKSLLDCRYDEHRALFSLAAKEGLHITNIEGFSMLEFANELLSLAKNGLDRIAAQSDIETESIYLQPLQQRLLDTPLQSQADILRNTFRQHHGYRKAIIDTFDLIKPYR